MRVQKTLLAIAAIIGASTVVFSLFMLPPAQPSLVFAVTQEQPPPPPPPPPSQPNPPPPGPWMCGWNETWDESRQICVYTPPPPPPTCQSGYYLDSNNQCRPNPPPVVCGPGYHLNYWETECYPDGPTSCASGMTLYGTFPNTWCECNNAGRQDPSSSCYVPPPPPPPNCPEGYSPNYWGECVQDPPPPPDPCQGNYATVTKSSLQRGEVIRIYAPNGYTYTQDWGTPSSFTSSNTSVLQIGPVKADGAGKYYSIGIAKSSGTAYISGQNWYFNGNRCSLSGPVVNVSDPPIQRCPTGNFVDAMIVTDRSGSMTDYNKMDSAKSAAKSFIDNFNSASDQIGLGSFSTSAVLEYSLTNNFGPLKDKIDTLYPTGTTNIGDAIKVGNQGLDGGRGGAVIKKGMALLTDGLANTPGYGDGNAEAVNWADSNAQASAAKGYKIYTIGLGNDVDEYFLANIAYITGGRYYFAPTGNELAVVYGRVATAICEELPPPPPGNPPTPNKPASPQARIYNTETGKAVGLNIACGHLLAKWSQVSGVDGYKVYNTTTNTLVGTVTGASNLQYDFEPANKTTAYSYAVTSYQGANESDRTTAIGSPIAPTWPCGASLSGSNKDIVRVRGITTPNDPSAVNDANVSSVSPIAEGDIVRFSLNVVNSGQKNVGSPITVTDTMTNLVKPSAGWGETMSCNNECTLAIQSYDANTSTLTFKITPTGGNVLAPGEFWSIQFNARTKAPAGTTASIFRIQNETSITYTDPDNGSLQVVTSAWLKTPYILVFRDLASPEVREIHGN